MTYKTKSSHDSLRESFMTCAPGTGDNLAVKVHYTLGSRKC